MTAFVTLSVSIATGFDFAAWAAGFDASYAPAGFGSFTDAATFSGDFVSSEAALTDTPDTSAAAFLATGALAYSLATHRIGGSLDGIAFGAGAYRDADTGALALAETTFTLGLSLSSDAGDPVHDLLVDLALDTKGAAGNTSTLMDWLADRAIAFTGGAGGDAFAGFGGDDLILGRAGADSLSGGAGDDRIRGNRGDDTLAGDSGDDILTGGRGADSFDFSGTGRGMDILRDFCAAEGDLLLLSAAEFADADAVLAALETTPRGLVLTGSEGSVLLVGVGTLDAADILLV